MSKIEVMDKKEIYSELLEAIINSKSQEELLKNTFPQIKSLFNAERIQIWEKTSLPGSLSISYDFCDSKQSMLKLRVGALSNNKKNIVEETETWYYTQKEDETLKRFNLNSLIGIGFKSKERILVLVSNKPLEPTTEDFKFLIKFKNQLEKEFEKLEIYNKSTDDAKRLLRQNIFLKEKEHEKIKFTNNICHEIKTPLSSILGFSKLLSSKLSKNKPQKEIAEQILQSASRLSALVSDLLQVNKHEQGSWKINYESCNVSEELKKITKEVLLLNKDCKIEYKSQEESQEVKTDPKLIRQVLDNLISNAIKYSKGKCEIDICLNFPNKKEFEISVIDKGIGIKKEDTQRIFNRYYRVKDPMVEAKAGSGLGLSICKEIISALNGKIIVESEPDKGSKFIITLPTNI